MTIKQLENEIDNVERAMFETKTIKEWDQTVRRYNELKIKWYQMSGESPVPEVINMTEYNLYKIPTRNV